MFQSQAQTERGKSPKVHECLKNTQLDRPNGGIWIYMQGRNNHDVEDKKRKKSESESEKEKGEEKRKRSSQRGKE